MRNIMDLEWEDLTPREKLASQIAFLKSGGQDSDIGEEDYEDADQLIKLIREDDALKEELNG